MRGTLGSIRKPDASFAPNHRVAAPKHTTGHAMPMPPAGEDQTLPLIAHANCRIAAVPHNQQADVLLEMVHMQSFRVRHDIICANVHSPIEPLFSPEHPSKDSKSVKVQQSGIYFYMLRHRLLHHPSLPSRFERGETSSPCARLAIFPTRRVDTAVRVSSTLGAGTFGFGGSRVDCCTKIFFSLA